MDEIYFAPTTKAKPITLEQLQQSLITAGLHCVVEEDSPVTHWLVLDPHETSLFVSTSGDQVTLATVNVSFDDEPQLMETIEQVMASIGFSADEEEDYA